MSRRLLVLAASIALVLAGCGIGKPSPPTTTYIVEPAMPTATMAGRQSGDIVRMGNVRTAAAFGGTSLVYRMDDVNFVSDPYQAFIADPGAMLGNEMATWLDRSGAFRSVAQPGSTQSVPYVLEATVTQLYGDFRPGKPPEAVMAVQFALVDVISIRPRIVFETTIQRREPIEKAAPDALVRGYGRALTQILTQFVSDLSTARLPAGERPQAR